MSAWGGRRAQELTARTLELYGPRCHLCLLPIRLDLPKGHKHGPSADHLVPRILGGTDDLDNLRPAHRSCNSRRGARPLTPELLARFRRRRATEAEGAFFR